MSQSHSQQITHSATNLPNPKNLRIIIYPDPVLEKVCKPVEDPTSDYIKACIERMKVVLRSMPNGIGLAASQVGLLLNIYVAYENLEQKEKGDIIAYINPVFDPIDVLSPVSQVEACMSFPGVSGEVIRPPSGELTYTNEQGEQVKETLHGLKARCAQHEIDHLFGINIIQSMTEDSRKKAQLAISRLTKNRR